jgi:hypothetical protein
MPGTWPSAGQDDFDMASLTSSPNSAAPAAAPTSTLPSSTIAGSSPAAATAQLRFPSSFADFRLPTSPSSSSLAGGHGQEGSATSSGLLAVGGPTLDAYPLFSKRLRRGSTLSMVNHTQDDGAETPPQPSPFHFAPPLPPGLGDSLGGPSRPQTPPNGFGSQTGHRPSSSSSSAMAVSPVSSKARLRSASPPAVPTLNPPSFRADSAGGLPRHPIHRLGMQRNHSFTGVRSSKGKGRDGGADSESPSEPEDQSPILSAATPALRPITRRGSLYPKHLAHISTARMLNEDPVTSEIKSEAQIQRLLQAQSSTPASSRLRQSSLSHAALVSARGRFPEDADDGDSDIFGSTKGGSSSSSSDDDLGLMMDDPDVVPPAPPPNSVAPALGQHFPRERFPSGLAGPAGITSAFGMALHAALASNPNPPPVTGLTSTPGLLTHRAANLSGSFSGSDGDALMGGTASPKSTTASPVGGWRETGSGRVNKRKAVDDVRLSPSLSFVFEDGRADPDWTPWQRYDPYGSSFAYKRRAVSPSTVFPPSGSLGFPPSAGSPTTHSRLPARIHSEAGPSSAATAPIPILSAAQRTTTPSSSYAPSSLHGPVSPYYTTSRSSRGGSPVPIPMSTSAGRMYGGSAPGLAGSGLGLSLLARDREGRRNDNGHGGIGGVWEATEGGFGGLKLGGPDPRGPGPDVG